MSSFQRIIKYVGMAFAILLTVGIIGGICAAIFGISGAANGKKTSSEAAKSGVYTFDEFTSMDISSGVADVEIVIGDHYEVEMIDVPDSMTAEVKSNGKLVIESKEKWHDWFGWFDNDSWNKHSKIIITVPEGYVAEDIVISAGTGDIEMNDLIAEYMELDGGVGSISGSNLTAKKVNIDAGVGNIELENVDFGDSDISSGVGDVTIDGVMNGDCEFDGGVGDMELTLEGSSKDYNLDIDGGVGTVRINGKKIDELEEDNGSNNHFEVDGGVGSISITFTQD